MKAKPKTYRVNAELAQIESERMIKYITENQEAVTEAQIVNASVRKGLKELSDDEIREFIKDSN